MTFTLLGQLRAQQEGPTIFADVAVPQPANAYELAKRISAPSPGFSGGTSVPIGVYTLRDGAIQLPISISNRVSGVRVAEVPSWVGSGWSLSAGGIITRSIKGSPDEGGYRILNAGGTTSLGFLNGGLAKGAQYDAMQGDFHRYQRECLGARTSTPCMTVSPPPNRPADCNSRGATFQGAGWLTSRDLLAKQLAAGVWDTESDIYFFSFGQYSGSFRFAENGTVLQAELSDIRFQPGPNLESFVATDPAGVKYWFGKHPVTGVTAYDKTWSTVALGRGEPAVVGSPTHGVALGPCRRS